MRILIWILFVCVSPLALFAQTITTFAGTGVCARSGDGGSALDANISYCASGVFDKKGNYYFVDGSETVRKISPTGEISTVCGSGATGFYGDGGPATLARLNQPTCVAVDEIGDLFVADEGNNRIRKIDTFGIIRTIAGNGTLAYSGDNSPATSAGLWAPNWVVVDTSRNIYEIETVRIRRISTDGIITTVAGNGVSGFSGDGGPATLASINPISATIDARNNIYVADLGNYRIRKIGSDGKIATIAGTGVVGYSGDNGPATSAKIKPYAIAADLFGNIFVADGNQVIRKINSSGIITTIAGTGAIGFAGDGGNADTAKFHDPEGVALDSCGNIYIADANNCRIRKISFPHCSYLQIDEAITSLDIAIYPNPCMSEVSLSIAMASQYTITNWIGTVVRRGQLLRGFNILSLRPLPPGLYLLELIDDEGRRTIHKIVKR